MPVNRITRYRGVSGFEWRVQNCVEVFGWTREKAEAHVAPKAALLEAVAAANEGRLFAPIVVGEN